MQIFSVCAEKLHFSRIYIILRKQFFSKRKASRTLELNRLSEKKFKIIFKSLLKFFFGYLFRNVIVTIFINIFYRIICLNNI